MSTKISFIGYTARFVYYSPYSSDYDYTVPAAVLYYAGSGAELDSYSFRTLSFWLGIDGEDM